MDHSMAGEDSLFSTPGEVSAPNRRHALPQGQETSADASYEYNPDPDASGAYHDGDLGQSREEGEQSGQQPYQAEESHEYDNEESGEEAGEEEEGEGAAEEDDADGDADAVSEGSSADYDRLTDPVGYAKRLDGLAGVLEMREDEARAMKWGPGMGRERDAPMLSLADFKTLVNHHLASTEWKYTKPDYSTLPDRPGVLRPATGPITGDESWETHPIRVLSPDWMGVGFGPRVNEQLGPE